MAAAVDIQILDAVTLKQLKSFKVVATNVELITFSPDSHFLTSVLESRLVNTGMQCISWDLQTGAPVGQIKIGYKWPVRALSITSSGCGTMFGFLIGGQDTTTIDTYNVFSNTHIHSHLIGGLVVKVIWAHGKYIRFATLEPGAITIWEVEFASRHPAMKVESLPTPNSFDPSGNFLFLPALYWLAFTLGNTIFVWDAKHSKFLLHSVDLNLPKRMSFSPDGNFFACGTQFGGEFWLWKKSSTGSFLDKKSVSRGIGGATQPLLSPNGQSIAVFHNGDLHLWHINDLSSSTPHGLIQVHQPSNPFILAFSPNGSFAVVTRKTDKIVTILDLKSGITWLTIDAGVRVYGVGVAESTVIVIGDGKIITWDLPEVQDPNARVNINNSIQTAIFNHPITSSLDYTHVSVFSDLNYIAVADANGLKIYDMSTGKYLTGIVGLMDGKPWFTPDGCELWCGYMGRWRRWAVIKDGESNISKFEEYYSRPGNPPGGSYWTPHYGYQVTEDGWILSSSGKQLLWLPPHLQFHPIFSDQDYMWGGQFFAILSPTLPTAVILELPE